MSLGVSGVWKLSTRNLQSLTVETFSSFPLVCKRHSRHSVRNKPTRLPQLPSPKLSLIPAHVLTFLSLVPCRNPWHGYKRFGIATCVVAWPLAMNEPEITWVVLCGCSSLWVHACRHIQILCRTCHPATSIATRYICSSNARCCKIPKGKIWKKMKEVLLIWVEEPDSIRQVSGSDSEYLQKLHMLGWKHEISFARQWISTLDRCTLDPCSQT